MVVDTDVLIWYMRGSEKALRALERLGTFSISAITHMELVQGMRNKGELIAYRQTLRLWKTEILHVDEAISAKAIFFVEQYYLSHALQVADALIGATALAHGSAILTANDKQYKVLKDIQIVKFRP
jgi:predicted nucleic acid-binding protein